MESNHLLKFKADLWQSCVNNKVFNNISENELEGVKKTFENLVSNYTSQIMQTNETSFLVNVMTDEMKKIMMNFHAKSNNDMKSANREIFDSALEHKRNEFNNLIKKPSPEKPTFDNVSDEPINRDDLDKMINEQMSQRESLYNVVKSPTTEAPQNLEENEIVGNLTNNVLDSSRSIPQPIQPQNNLQMNNSSTSLIQQTLPQQPIIQQDNNEIKEQITELNKKMDSVINLLTQVIKSQITLLKKNK